MPAQIDPNIALGVKNSQIDPIQSLGQIYALKNAGVRSQIEQQQQQLQQYQLQQAGQQQQDAQAGRAAVTANVSTDPTTGMATLNRAGYLGQLAQTAPGQYLGASQAFTQQDLANQRAAADYQKTQLANAKAHTDFVGSLLQGVTDQATYTSALNAGISAGIVKPGEMPAVYDPQLVQRQLQQTMTQKDVIAQKQKQLDAAETARHNTQTETTAAATQAETANYHGIESKQRGQEIGIQSGRLAVEQQKVAISKGDPNAAAQLLVNGDATLSELKARGSTPEFIAQTLKAAHDLSGGKYNAQSAEAQFSVAKSPANVAFFGSAKSLTDKGGTLDQLNDAAKDIPGGKIPAFNSIADWEKAATGSGPIAKYASIALGVADDYAKVMGGGSGSDTSRMQALNLVGAKLSPEGRTGSIAGIRGTVGSQLNSRIGNNRVLGRMYGSDSPSGDAPTAAPAAGGFNWNQHPAAQ